MARRKADFSRGAGAESSAARQVLPGVEEAVALRYFDGGVEEAREDRGGEEALLRAVGVDTALAQKKDAIDLGDDVGGVVGDEDDGSSLPGELTEEGAKVRLRGEV